MGEVSKAAPHIRRWGCGMQAAKGHCRSLDTESPGSGPLALPPASPAEILASGPTGFPEGLVITPPASCRLGAELDTQGLAGDPGARNLIAACGPGFRPRNPRDGRCLAPSLPLGFTLSAGPEHWRWPPNRRMRSGAGLVRAVVCRAVPAGGPALPDLDSAVPTAGPMVADAQGPSAEDLVTDLCPNGEPCIVDGQAMLPMPQGFGTLNADISDPLPGAVEVLFVPEREEALGPPSQSPRGDRPRPPAFGPRDRDRYNRGASQGAKDGVRQGVPNADGGTEPARVASSRGQVPMKGGAEMRLLNGGIYQDALSLLDIPEGLARPREREDGDGNTAGDTERAGGPKAQWELCEGVPQEGAAKRGAEKAVPRATVGGWGGRVRAGRSLALMKGWWQAYKCTTFGLVPVSASLRRGYKASDSLADAQVRFLGNR